MTRRRVLGGAAALLLTACWGGAARAAVEGILVIDPEVRTAVARGSARVLVELRLVPGPGQAAPDPQAARERAIATARQTVLGRLSGTSHRLVRQYTSIPLLALEIGPDALQALETMSDVVTRVRVEQVRPAVRPPATPA